MCPTTSYISEPVKRLDLKIHSRPNKSSFLLEGMKDGDTLVFRTPSGKRFTTELVQSRYATKKGLMYRDGLPSKTGMFFLFTDPPHRRGMWMNNMRFPLDIVWLDGALKIVSIRKDVQPCISAAECPSISSIYKAQHAIELTAGDADALGLSPGDTLRFVSTKAAGLL